MREPALGYDAPRLRAYETPVPDLSDPTIIAEVELR